jgi:Na+/proline symporter
VEPSVHFIPVLYVLSCILCRHFCSGTLFLLKGGMKAVIWVDVVQSFIIILGVLLSIVFGETNDNIVPTKCIILKVLSMWVGSKK